MHVFTYGSLMYPEVWTRVVAGSYQSSPATLRGYARHRLPGEVYPAMVEAGPDASIRGVVHLDVSPADIATLDRFEDEGVHYGRIDVELELEGGVPARAVAYVYLHPDRVAPDLWNQAEFERTGLAEFLGSYVRDRVTGA